MGSAIYNSKTAEPALDFQSESIPYENVDAEIEVLHSNPQLPRLALGKLDGFGGTCVKDTKADMNKETQAKDGANGKEAAAKTAFKVQAATSAAHDCPPLQASTAMPQDGQGHHHVETTSQRFVEVVFDAQGDEKTVRIFQRPLGAEFNKKKAGGTKIFKITPQSYASELGLEIGWGIKSIDGEVVSNKTFKETQDTLIKCLKSLPEQPCH